MRSTKSHKEVGHTSQLSEGMQLMTLITPHFTPSSSSVSSSVAELVFAAPVKSGKLEIPMFTAMARLTLPTNSVLNKLPDSASSYADVVRAIETALSRVCLRLCRTCLFCCLLSKVDLCAAIACRQLQTDLPSVTLKASITIIDVSVAHKKNVKATKDSSSVVIDL